MGLFSKLKPGSVQPKIEDDAELLCDLDQIVEKQIYFRVNGKDHLLKPVTLERFFEFLKNLLEINKVQDDPEKVRKNYVTLIQAVCQDFTRLDADRLTHFQASRLVVTIANKLMGTSEAETQKKNLAESLVKSA